jgi:hypothetical protein
MTKRLLILAAVLLAAARPVAAAENRLALGIMVGEPTGISGKYWLGPDRAVDGGASWSVSHDNAFDLHADYLFHDFGVFEIDSGYLPLYYGVGGRLLMDHRNRVGLRLPVGLSFLTDTRRVEFFMEAVPTMDLVPDTEFEMGGGLGVRFLLP